MPFSHHSHSGQFCLHAKDSLEEVIQTAIARGMHTFALTEHMPRDEAEDLYPEEIEASQTPATLSATFTAYYAEAVRLRAKYASRITLLLGFETDWIRPSNLSIIQTLLSSPAYTHGFDLFVGSVHHVHTIPIDFDTATYARARAQSGGSDEALARDYFDAQLDMLSALRPPVVGHFDLIRLKSEDPDRDFRLWDGAWAQIRRNLEFVVAYGGLLEVNSAALRKGLKEPYPTREICELYLSLGGKFTLSDDSHGIDQVGLNYARVITYLESVGVKEVYYFSKREGAADISKPQTTAVTVAELKSHQLATGPITT